MKKRTAQILRFVRREGGHTLLTSEAQEVGSAAFRGEIWGGNLGLKSTRKMRQGFMKTKHNSGQRVDLENLIFQAGEATEQPPLPQMGIPRQKVPGWIRWPIRVFFLPFVLLDVAMQKLARWLIPPPYKQIGTCKKRGNCCHYIMIRKPKGLLGWIFKFWNTEFNGFYPRSTEDYEYEGHKVMVMGCRYLQKDGSCKHHKLRPMVCRKWPVIEHFGIPRMLKGCGFKAIPRKPGDSLPIIEE